MVTIHLFLIAVDSECSGGASLVSVGVERKLSVPYFFVWTYLKFSPKSSIMHLLTNSKKPKNALLYIYHMILKIDYYINVNT